MIINNNIPALNTYRQMGVNQMGAQNSMEKLASGLRINRAGDDAAGLAISEKMRAQIRGLDQASRNSQDGISMIQTAEGALQETQNILQRMRELAAQAANDTNVEVDRNEIQKEMNALTSEINRIGNTTEFNTQNLLNGGPQKTGNINANVESAGAPSGTPTGQVSDINTMQNSVKGGTGEVSALSVDRASVATQAGQSAVGAVSNVHENTASVVSGTGAIGNFQEIDKSIKEANAGSIGNSFHTIQSSITGGTGAITAVSELVEGRGGVVTHDATTAAVAGTLGVNTLQITNDIDAGGTIEIAGQTFTAVTGTADASAGEFSIDGDIEATRDSLLLALQANTTITDDYTVAGSGTDSITFTEINATGNNININTTLGGTPGTGAITDTETTAADAATAGVDTYTIGSDFAVGQTFAVAGQTFTAVSGTADASAGEFSIDGDIEATRDSLLAALNANTNITDNYTVATDGNDGFTLTEIVSGTGGSNAGASTVAGTADTAVYAFEITANFTEGDTITIGGQTFTAATSGGNTGSQFEIGTTIEDTRNNILASLAQNTTLNAAYTFSSTDPQWNGQPDANLIVLTAQTAGADANQTDMNATSVTQTGSHLGEYGFEIATNFEAGQTISINGYEFTAATSGGNTATQFEIGTDVSQTANNLLAAINAAKSGGAAEFTNFDASIGGAGIYSDTIILTEVAASGTDLTATDIAVGDVAAQEGKYTFEVTENFSIGDKITIAGVELTAGTSNSATTFEVGADIETTVSNIVAAINLSSLNSQFDAAAINDKWGTANTIELKEDTGAISGTDLVAGDITVNRVTETQGDFSFMITNNFVAGETITIASQEFKAVESGADTANGEFNVGTDLNTTAANLVAAINGTIGTDYTASNTGAEIRLVEQSGKATGTILADPSVAGVGAVSEVTGQYSFSITDNFSVGDKLELDGVTFEAVASGADASAGQFNVGSTIGETMSSLVVAINAASTNVRFDASMVTDNTDPLNPQHTINLAEKSGQATGDDSLGLASDKVAEVAGIYTFEVTTNFVNDEQLTIGGTTLVAGRDFDIGSTIDETVTNLRAAISANSELSDRFTATSSGNAIALTENANKATGTDLANPVITVDAIAGEFKFEMSSLRAGSTITLDGTELSIAKGGTAEETAAELKALIEADSTLDAKYAVNVDGANITLTQKAGQESGDVPTISYTAEAPGFTANFQIGANTGQSMSINIGDMRAQALNISGAEAGAQITAQNGAIASYVAIENVTNGTDNNNVEFALDVSTHEKATAAISVINDAIEAVSAQRSQLGAFQNRLEHTISNLNNAAENLQAAESRVRDVDMAREVMDMTKNNILAQASQAMLAQANQAPQAVLQLLG